ncbi:MAG TPA: glycosyltransferase family 39 protein [Candidatus Dormibacteraeota bacterium]|nr:glycosyltransferase family 39 protein [Candidatus Dormibacteraeota bacterium]
MKVLPRILADDEDEVEQESAFEADAADEAPASHSASLHWAWTVALCVGAALPRLLYLFVFSDPENPGIRRYGDVWHHWQIAYLTKEIGLTAPNGPRLWDLKGLDYFWGILHPLLMVVVFDLTGSIDIVLNRLVSLAFGVLVVVLLFHTCRRHWGTQVALGAALIAILLPTSVMNDASGMLEPLGVSLVLLGVWAWPRKGGFWAGLAFGLATMARAEAWVFSLGLVIAAFFRREGRQQRLPLLVGFVVVMLLYMKVLQDKTGNAIYPLWWNFLANAVGKWEVVPVSASQASVRPVLGAALILAVIGLGWSLVKRPPSYMLLTFGFGYWVFVAGMLGFTSYLASWVWWMPITRAFAFPYVFAGVLLAVALLGWLPRRFGRRALPAAWAGMGATLLVTQLAWLPIAAVFGPSETEWQAVKAESIQLGAWYNQQPYSGHALAVPPERPDITYGLARFGGVEGKHLVSEMYDPFAYLPASYKYTDHQAVVTTLVECWLSDNDIRIIAVPFVDPNFALLQQLSPSWFISLGSMPEASWEIVGVSAPRPTASDCAVARSASR